MELNVNERFTLLGILPKEGNFLTLKILRKLREELSFNESEIKALGFKSPGQTYVNDDGVTITVPDNSLHWDPRAPQTKEFDFGAKATELITDVLKELDKQKKLTDAHFSIYEKFLGEEK